MTNEIIRLDAAARYMGIGRASIYARLREGLITPQVKLGGHACGWPVREIDAINAARIAGKNNDDIRALVVRLTAERQEGGVA